jgi:large subunit ribosomal protein L21
VFYDGVAVIGVVKKSTRFLLQRLIPQFRIRAIYDGKRWMRIIFKEVRSMYAVVMSGGKQYKVEEGETLRVEKIAGEVGSPVTFDRVLMISDGTDVNIGQPVVADATVEGHIVEQGKARKILVFKYKRRKRYRRTQGHRQHFTAIKIDSIKSKGIKAGKKAEPESKAEKPADAKVKPEAEKAPSKSKAAAAPKAAAEKKEAKKPATKAAPKKKAAPKAAAKKAPARKAAAKKPAAKKAAAPKTTAKKAPAKKAAAKKTAPKASKKDES